ncbi:hypothetical protein BG46_01455 [Brucella anthropi]|uniref:phage tail tube protein n=1 Tax=Brucella anthropi TaxID=529 RepID=UPI000446BA0E|nr:phage tail tube protein [Brucella anthropi]EXL08219.1 hypothetical protein BG46_01455 [Brucella anthropi]
MARRWNKLAMLFKLEATYGADAAPTAADAILGTNVTFTPFEGEEVSRDLLLPYMGNQGVVLAGIYGRIEFDFEIAGAGAPGDIPRYGSVLRAAGMAETVVAGTSVEYTIIEDDVESGSLYFVSDKVQHVLLGCQVNIAPSLSPSAIPRFRATVMGLVGTISDIATMPAVSAADWITPKHVSKANTTMSLHGWNAIAESISLDLGNTLTPRMLIGAELIMISARSTTGTVVVQAESLATINWFQRALDRTRGALTIVHGTEAGNIVELQAPAVEIGRPTQSQTNGISNYSLPLSLCPVDGMDELSILVR